MTTISATQRAIDAIRSLYGTKPGLPPGVEDEGSLETHDHYAREAIARRAVTDALRGDATVAQLALATGLRQLLIAKLVDDPLLRPAALVGARLDAERYDADVRETIRADVVRAVADGMSESEAARRYSCQRGTVRAWTGKD